MGGMWTAYWCDRCVHDHRASHLPEGHPDQEWSEGCDLLGRMYMGYGEDFPELRDRNAEDFKAWQKAGERGPLPGWDPAKLECRLYERCTYHDRGDDGDPPPRPPAPDPNQLALFGMVDDSPWTPGGAVIPERLSDEEGAEHLAIHGRPVENGPAL